MKAVRNLAIIVLLALALTLLPAGSNVAEGILVFLGLLMGLAIVALLIRLWRDTGLQRDTFTDRQRWLIYGSMGAIALMVVGARRVALLRPRDGRLDRDPGGVRLAHLQHLAGSPEPVGRRRGELVLVCGNVSRPVAETSLRTCHACAGRF